jgi:CRP/FNR family cyclic AMP-dependent transcriptional regulator
VSLDHFWIELIGYVGTAFTAASYSMRTIIPLRIAAILSSAFFVVYAILIGSLPMLITELIILPLNVARLIQVMSLTRQIAQASTTDLSFEWLAPFGQSQKHEAGEVLFSAGDGADHLLLINSGRFRLAETSIELGAGEVVGELGFLSPGNRRTMTLVCIAAGETAKVSYSDIKQLYFQNPRFGFFLLQLVGERLFQNIERAKAQGAAPAVAPVQFSSS